MQNDDRDSIKKTISEYIEAMFAAMLNKHYTHAALYMICMIGCVPSKLNLEAIEALRQIRHQMKMRQLMRNDCSNGLMLHYLQLSVRWRMSFEFKCVTERANRMLAPKISLTLPF
jgi:hypothetical protein